MVSEDDLKILTIPQSGLIRWYGPTVSVISSHPEMLYLTNNCCVKKWCCKKSSARTLTLTKTSIGQRSDNPWKKLDFVWEGQKSVLGSVGWFYQLGQAGTTGALVPEGPDVTLNGLEDIMLAAFSMITAILMANWQRNGEALSVMG